jgi:hypothetical protein
VKKIGILAVLALVALVSPVQAKGPGEHAKSHKCKPHAVAYRVAGTLVSGSLTKNDDGTYSGDLTVHVTRTNHHARADKGTDKSYALDHAKVNLHDQDPAALVAGSKVKLKGKVTKLAKKCDSTGFTAETKIKRANIQPPKPPTD